MPLTDAEYLKKFGYTREEGLEKKKERQRKYMKKYHQNKVAKKAKKRGRKKVTVHRVHKKVFVELTIEDLFIIESIRAEAFELYRGGVNELLARRS